jgi:hypothetical protein
MFSSFLDPVDTRCQFDTPKRNKLQSNDKRAGKKQQRQQTRITI